MGEGALAEKIPQRLGRYEIVGKLATGGMAEILLGRLQGPSGFERAVVIKRILPHLAAVSEFVDMFLDEGRIAGRIGHPNVAQVFELQREDEELFQVMEYLEGESSSGVIRRLRAQRGTLDPLFAAHIVAEVCAGLHAAHELRDQEDRFLGVVHRDVSPDNIFVGYDGTVKVLDFGIAMAGGRLTKTEVGTVKGKFGYMSPEQTEGASLDRRSDVFSLGIVLYELSTQRRLFARGGAGATIRAITEDAIVPPSRVVPGYPEALERVCLRALSRDVEKRFETAKEMQIAILSAMQEAGAPTIPGDALGELMRELFPDRIREKADMLRRMQDGVTPTHVPKADVDEGVELPSIDVDFYLTEATPAMAPRPKRWPWVLGIVAILGALGAAFFVASFFAAPSAPAPSATVAVAPAEEASVPEPVPALPPTVEMTLRTEPPGARVRVDGTLRGTTPAEIELRRGDEPVTLRFELPGYEPSEEVLVPDESGAIDVELVRLIRRTGRRRPRMEEAPRPPAEMAPAEMRAGWRRFN